MTLPPQSNLPLLVETLSRPSFPMVRCHYLSIESDEPRPGWNLGLEGSTFPFLMLNLVGIIQQPFDAPRFSNNNLIDGLFELVEEKASFSVNFEDIWMPDFLFEKYKVTVGDVYRVSGELFTAAYQFRDGRISYEEFGTLCRELNRQIEYSEEESFAFKQWTREQISSAIAREPKNPELRLRTRPRSNETES